MRTTIFLAVERYPEVRQPRYVPPEPDFWAVYDHIANLAEGGDPVAVQDRAMMATLLYTAARRGEVFRLKFGDLDFENAAIRLYTCKRKGGNREGDWLPMTRELRRELLAWIKTRMTLSGLDPDHVFVNVDTYLFSQRHYGRPFKHRQHWLGRVCERVKVSPFGFHAIRHFTASTLYRAGHTVAVIQVVMRHKSATMNEKYLRSLGFDIGRRVQKALEGSFRRGPAQVIEMKRPQTGNV